MRRLLLAVAGLFAWFVLVVIAGTAALFVKNLLRGSGEVTGWATGITWVLVALSCMTALVRDAITFGEVTAKQIPKWTGYFYAIYVFLFIVLAVLDWKWAVGLFVALFLLAMFGISGFVGELLWGQALSKYSVRVGERSKLQGRLRDLADATLLAMPTVPNEDERSHFNRQEAALAVAFVSLLRREPPLAEIVMIDHFQRFPGYRKPMWPKLEAFVKRGVESEAFDDDLLAKAAHTYAVEEEPKIRLAWGDIPMLSSLIHLIRRQWARD